MRKNDTALRNGFILKFHCTLDAIFTVLSLPISLYLLIPVTHYTVLNICITRGIDKRA